MKRALAIPVFLVTLLAMSATGCGAKAPERHVWDSAVSANPKAESAFRDARELFSRGNLGDADEAFARLITSYPIDPLARVATVYRARIALEMDHPKRARQLLADLIADRDPVADRAKLYDGVSLYRLNQPKEAIARLTPIRDRLTDPDETTLLLETLWKAERDTGDSASAVLTIDRLLSQTVNTSARDDAVTALKAIVDGTQDAESLTRLADALPDNKNAWPILMTRAAEIYLEAGKFKASADILEAIDNQQSGKETDIEAIAEAVDNRIAVNMDTVGLLVPLSGRSRLVGETVVQGAMIAATETGLSVVIKDTKGDPKRTETLVEELVAQENVFAIVGPLDVATAKAAAKKAEEMKTPIILMTVQEDLVDVGSYVFRHFPSNSAEIDTLLDRANRSGYQRLAIMYPDNGFGKALYDTARSVAADKGLTVVESAVYDPSATTFETAAQALARQTPDVILILDTPSRVALIAPAIAAAGLWSVHTGDAPAGPGEPVQLLIPSFGFSPDLVRRAGRYLSGAIFSLYYVPAVTPDSEDFARRFNIDYGRQPNYLSAFGHDAVVILNGATRANLRDRDEVRRWLVDNSQKNLSRLHTSAPFSGFAPNGAPLAVPWLMELYEGAMVQVTP